MENYYQKYSKTFMNDDFFHTTFEYSALYNFLLFLQKLNLENRLEESDIEFIDKLINNCEYVNQKLKYVYQSSICPSDIRILISEYKELKKNLFNKVNKNKII